MVAEKDPEASSPPIYSKSIPTHKAVHLKEELRPE